MTHQPYEEWMLSDQKLTNQQKKDLYEHLISCNECNLLRKNWDYFENALTKLPEMSPAEGFTQRWRVEVQQRTALKQRRQMQLFFAIFFGTVVLLTGFLVTIFITSQSSYEWLLVTITNVIKMVVQSGKILQALISWVGVIPPVYSITVGVVFFSLFGLLGLTWMYIFIVHVYRRGASFNENNI